MSDYFETDDAREARIALSQPRNVAGLTFDEEIAHLRAKRVALGTPSAYTVLDARIDAVIAQRDAWYALHG